MHIILSNDLSRQAAKRAIDSAPEGYQVTIKERTRTLDQNAILHATIGDIAKQKKWAGENLSVDDWKRLLTAAWCRTTGESAKIVPAIDGHGFDVIYRRTSKLSKSECSELLEFVTAWAVDQGVKLSAPERM